MRAQFIPRGRCCAIPLRSRGARSSIRRHKRIATWLALHRHHLPINRLKVAHPRVNRRQHQVPLGQRRHRSQLIKDLTEVFRSGVRQSTTTTALATLLEEPSSATPFDHRIPTDASHRLTPSHRDSHETHKDFGPSAAAGDRGVPAYNLASTSTTHRSCRCGIASGTTRRSGSNHSTHARRATLCHTASFRWRDAVRSDRSNAIAPSTAREGQRQSREASGRISLWGCSSLGTGRGRAERGEFLSRAPKPIARAAGSRYWESEGGSHSSFKSSKRSCAIGFARS